MIAQPKRDGRGLFRPGTAPGPGRPPGTSKAREFEKRYLSLTRDTVTEEDWRAIVTVAVKDAKRGDSRARDWLAKFVLPPLPVIIAGLEINTTTIVESPEDKWREAIAKATPEQLRVLRELIADDEPAAD